MDISGVMEVIAQNLVNPIYPNGLMSPSVCGVDVTIEQGWPIRTVLDKALQSGKAHVSVYPTNMERPVTKFQREYQLLDFTPPSLTLTVSGQTVTITGIVETPQAVMIIVNGVGFSYGVQEGDTLNTIATNTAALIAGATSLNNVITVPSAYSLIARTATPYSAAEEIARTDRVFMISCWCPNQAIRASLGAAIDVYMKQNYRIEMPDGFYAQVFYKSTGYTDQLEKSLIYREDLNYTIQYATTVTNDFTSIADPFANVEFSQ